MVSDYVAYCSIEHVHVDVDPSAVSGHFLVELLDLPLNFELFQKKFCCVLPLSTASTPCCSRPSVSLPSTSPAFPSLTVSSSPLASDTPTPSISGISSSRCL